MTGLYMFLAYSFPDQSFSQLLSRTSGLYHLCGESVLGEDSSLC